jgi:hypothetical protein
MARRPRVHFAGGLHHAIFKRKPRTGFVSFRNRPEEISLRPHEESYSPSFGGRRDLSEKNNAVYFVSVYALFEGQLEKDLELTEMIEKLKANLIQRAKKKYLITIA